MKVLMISGDPLAFNPESGVHQRLLLQASQTDFLTVFVSLKGSSSKGHPLGKGAPLAGNPQVKLDNRGIVRGFSGNKLQIARGMLKAAKGVEFDIITAQDPLFLGHIAWHIARRSKANWHIAQKKQHPYLQFQVHGDIFSREFAQQSIVNRLKIRWALFHLRRADCIRVVSNKIKESLIERGIKAPISVLPIFVDLQKFRTVERKPHTGKDILWIGRFEPEKNPQQATEIFEEVLKSEPDARLTMLGEGTLKAQLVERTKTFSHGQISFPGWADPVEYLTTADIVVCTSMHESWGASIIEALAAGVPVVAPDVGIAGEAGAIVVARNELARVVVEVLRSNPQAELRLDLPDSEEWAKRWYAGLLQCCPA